MDKDPQMEMPPPQSNDQHCETLLVLISQLISLENNVLIKFAEELGPA
jgi:hypothetical protein